MLNHESVPAVTKGLAPVNGISMYYEVYGSGEPLVLIHGGGSTIDTTFGRVIPLLAGKYRLIAVELQAHGRTTDRPTVSSFEQDADDVAALLHFLSIDKASIFGFSNGGTTALQMAIRHPSLVNKLILASALAKREGVPSWFWDFMNNATLSQMPLPLQEAYRAVAPDPNGLQRMHDLDANRMKQFVDIPDELIREVTSKSFVIAGDKDVITIEHTVWLHRQLPGSELAIIPGAHGEYMGEVTTLQPGYAPYEWVIPLICRFLDKD